VVETVTSGMEKLAAQDERLGPSYQYLAVTDQGGYRV
jgi:hypothetical protein